MFSKHTRKRGFTMIELLVSIFILVVITGMLLANLRRGAKNDDLRQAGSEVASILRKAQNLALIGSQFNLPSGASNTGIFGVHFNSGQDTDTQYILFLDFKDDAEQSIPDGKYQIGEELPNSTYYLPLNIIFTTLDPNTSGILDITFKPPKPTIYFNNSQSNPLATIEVLQENTGNNRYITVNYISGQISIITEI